jgi:YesN/AraC family two-component response regulator
MEMIRDSRGNVSLNDCADKLSYHPNYLSKVLKREKGITFTDMINEEKLKLAKYMLLTTDYTVAEISEELQYNNVQNFIRFFKKQVDSTPAAFRKEHRK